MDKAKRIETPLPPMASRSIAMNGTHSPPDMIADLNVERIRARIRKQRFTLFDARRLKWQIALLGAIFGFIANGCWFAMQVIQYAAVPATKTITLTSLMSSGIQTILVGVFAGAAVGLGIGRLIFGLVGLFRPMYVALFYSPREFEQQYSDEPQFR
jgi:hypothetical protein